MTSTTNWGFTSAAVLLFVTLLSMILVVFQLSGWAFALSLILLLGVLLWGLLGAMTVYGSIRWSWSFLMPVPIVMLVYSLVVYTRQGMIEYLGILITGAIILFLVTVINMRLVADSDAQPKVQVYERLPEKVEPVKAQKASSTAKSASVSSSVTPGRFVASKFGTTYHTAKCDWAKKVRKRNQVWFKTKDEAKRAKLRPHSCIK